MAKYPIRTGKVCIGAAILLYHSGMAMGMRHSGWAWRDMILYAFIGSCKACFIFIRSFPVNVWWKQSSWFSIFSFCLNDLISTKVMNLRKNQASRHCIYENLISWSTVVHYAKYSSSLCEVQYFTIWSTVVHELIWLLKSLGKCRNKIRTAS